MATPDALFGVSGAGNLFKPGSAHRAADSLQSAAASASTPTTRSGTTWRRASAWPGIPTSDNSPLHWLLGGGGKSVLRAGYSIAYDREGNAAFGALANNPGGFVSATRSLTLGNLVTGTGSDTLPLLLRQTSRLGAPAFPDAPSYPDGELGQQLGQRDRSQSQDAVRAELVGRASSASSTRNTVVEVRYIGNHLARQWSTINLNEVNVVENGFLNEFQAGAGQPAGQYGGRPRRRPSVRRRGHRHLAPADHAGLLQRRAGRRRPATPPSTPPPTSPTPPT